MCAVTNANPLVDVFVGLFTFEMGSRVAHTAAKGDLD